MLSAFTHVITAGTTATLLWIACIGLAILAVVLYFPQQFSGPLTKHERRAFRGVLRRRALALVFAAPIATLAGFFALLPPIVTLRVPPPVTRTGADSGPHSFFLDSVALEVSTEPWMKAVRCRIIEDVVGEQTLARAIVTAAEEGFAIPIDCVSPRALGPWARTSVELSLVEIAARAYLLAGVELSPGPRRQDPDPWDIMADNLNARGIAVHVDGRDGATDAGILRLTRARLSGADAIQVHALVDACEASYDGRLLHPDGRVAVPSCRFMPVGCDASLGQQMVKMSVTCAGFHPAEHDGGLLLAAGQGETPLRFETREPIRIRVEDEHLREALQSDQSPAFVEEMRRRALRRLEVAEDRWTTTIHRGVRVEGPRAVEPDCPLPPDHGPFSYSGMVRPDTTHKDNNIMIRLRPEVFDRSHESYDPTEVVAALSTLTWAANAVETGICNEREEPPADSPRIARPLLTLAEMDAVVTALRRDRDVVGLILLAFAVLSLALGLRRSVR